MTDTPPPATDLVIDRYLKHPPQKVWRALTESDLMSRWLMTNDFRPLVGHHFQLRRAPMPQWNGIVQCEVLEVNPPHSLSYRWNVLDDNQNGLRTIVTWSLTPTPDGTRLRMEHTGFLPAQVGNRDGAEYGWSQFLAQLESVLNELN